MRRTTVKCSVVFCHLLAGATDLRAQKPPNDVFPRATHYIDSRPADPGAELAKLGGAKVAP